MRPTAILAGAAPIAKELAMPTLLHRVAGLLPIAALALSAFTAVAARAETISVPVSIAGLDLSTAAGRSRLDLRLVHAADIACGSRFVPYLAQQRQIRRCRVAALGDARAQARLAVAEAEQRQAAIQLAGAN
jgi:UrcA family protein